MILEKALNENFVLSLGEAQMFLKMKKMPVLLSNNGFSESVEGVLESYGLPKRGEVDPTTVMSFSMFFYSD